jgi:CheY-like chemotaxis protein
MDQINCYNLLLEVRRLGVIPVSGGQAMKSALLLEYDPEARRQIAALLESLGYLVGLAASPQAALHTAQTIRFDLVLSCTAFNADDRRSFAGELARLAPQAIIVFLVDSGASGTAWHDRNAALLFKPVTLRALRRVIDFGIDGLGAQAVYLAPDEERRRQPPRRARAR